MPQNDSLMQRRRCQGSSQIDELSGALRRIPDAGDLLDRVTRPDDRPARRPSSPLSTPAVRTEKALRADSVHVCRVETVLANHFSAIFTEPGGVDKRVRFPRTLVAPSDRHLLREGAVFYWITGTTRDADGDVVAKSYIRFKRTPRISADELAELDRMATEVILAAGGTPIGYEDVS